MRGVENGIGKCCKPISNVFCPHEQQSMCPKHCTMTLFFVTHNIFSFTCRFFSLNCILLMQCLHLSSSSFVFLSLKKLECFPQAQFIHHLIAWIFQVQYILFSLNKRLFLETFNPSSFQQENLVDDEGGSVKPARIRKAVIYHKSSALFHHYNPACLGRQSLNSLQQEHIATSRYKQLEDAFGVLLHWGNKKLWIVKKLKFFKEHPAGCRSRPKK